MSAPLFILSFRQRDELAALAAEDGRQVVAARRADGAERRFRASRAAVAVIDARGAFEDGLAATRVLGPVAAERRAALLALVSRADAGRVNELFEAGATHFLTSPFSAGEFRDALRFAGRHAERLVNPGARMPSIAEGGLAADLRRALAADEIEMLFQPQVDVASGAIVGAEALMRWNRGAEEIGAEALLDAAAQAGLTLALSARAQARALEIAAGWPEPLSALRLSINVTAEDLEQDDFLDQFLARVDASGFPRARLTVEITETGLIADLEAGAALLDGLRAAGLRVAIDDFGTGYSSLAYLNALPLDYLKIDKRLAQDIAGSARDRVVVRGVIEMARSLGLEVIAEGVETAEQLEMLAREGCGLYQGFLCAGPMGSEALAGLVNT